MNKQVVFYRAENDITDIVLQSLNKAYQGSAAAAKTPARAASATAPAGTN
jgi:hypothetical protein